MKILAILGFCFFLSGCADNWSRSDTMKEIVVDGVLALDAYQTAQYQHHATQREIGWARGICGARPSNGCSAGYFGSVMLSHYVIARLLPVAWRPYWQGGTVAFEAPIVYRNTRLKE